MRVARTTRSRWQFVRYASISSSMPGMPMLCTVVMSGAPSRCGTPGIWPDQTGCKILLRRVTRTRSRPLRDLSGRYSSLSYLHQFLASYIRLDRSFFAGADSSKTSPAVISGIVQIAQNLGIQVISGGVESLANQQFARSIGCNFVQGYYYAQPQTATRAAEILEAHRE